MWTPPWPSIEPSTFDRAKHTEYGSGAEAQAAGRHHGAQPVHGYLRRPVRGGSRGGDDGAWRGVGGALRDFGEPAGADDAGAISRGAVRLRAAGAIAAGQPGRAHRRDAWRTSAAPIARSDGRSTSRWGRRFWSAAPPSSAPRPRARRCSRAISAQRHAENRRGFSTGPSVREGRRTADLRVYTDAPSSSAFSTHLMDPHQSTAFFTRLLPRLGLAFSVRLEARGFSLARHLGGES